MHAEIMDGFDNLAKERAQLIKILSDKNDKGTSRLEFWPLFNTRCVIAKSQSSDVRKKLNLEMAVDLLNKAKNEMEIYGFGQDDFLKVENALTLVINTLINKLATGKYKSSVSEMRNGPESSVVSPSPNCKGG